MTEKELDQYNARLLHYVRPELSKAAEWIIAKGKCSGHRLMVSEVRPRKKMFEHSIINESHNAKYAEGEGVSFSFTNRQRQLSMSVNDPVEFIEDAARQLGLIWGGEATDAPDNYFVAMPTREYQMPALEGVRKSFFTGIGFLEIAVAISIVALLVYVAVALLGS
ncbi:MAG: hypothetical protein ABL952_15635 [Pyrinomonadaceae bacterium]